MCVGCTIRIALIKMFIILSRGLSKIFRKEISHGRLWRTLCRMLDNMGCILFCRGMLYQDLELKDIRKILLIRLDRIGDVVLATSILRPLKKAFPNAEIAMLVGPWSAPLLSRHPLIDKIITFKACWWYDEVRNFRQNIIKIKKLARQLRIQNFDIGINMRGIPFADPWTNLLMALSKIPIRVAFDTSGIGFLLTKRVRFREGQHIVDQNLDLIRAIGVNVTTNTPSVPLCSDEFEFGYRFLKQHQLSPNDKIIGIHPGGTSDYKRWSKESFAMLCDVLIEKYQAKIIIFGGPDEVVLAQEISNLMHFEPVIAAGQTSLRETGALLSYCKLMISNDTGIKHLTAAVNVPVIALCGPDNYHIWKAYGPNHIHLSKDLPCSKPCVPVIVDMECPIGRKCMTEITVEEVLGAVAKQLKRVL